MTFIPNERLKNVKKSATRRLYDSAPEGSINLGLGEPDFMTPEVVRREAIRVINEERISYTANAGLLALRQSIAAYHSADFASPLTADSICVMTGVEEALFATVMTIAGPGDEVLLPDPCFNAYPTIVEIAGAQVTRYSMPASTGFAFDRDSFEKALTDRTKLIFIGSPSNPTGRVLGRDDLKFIADRLNETNIYVVSDEIYRDLYFNERPSSISEFFDKTIVVAGLSKMMSMTGWRLGWTAGPEDVVRHITVMHQYISTCASAVSQKAAIVAFTQEGRQATAEIREELLRRRDVAVAAIERELDLPYVIGEGAYYVMLDVSQFGASEDVAWALLEERVITVPGSAFGAESEGYLRISFSIEPSQIEEGIRRVAQGLNRLRG